jgi:hypothetical protein
MAFTYDLSTNAGKVRMIVPDNQATSYVFEDDELEALLALESANVRRAAALALETIASNEVMVLKVIKLLDLQTDGAKTSDALLKRAAQLRAQADADELGEEGGAFDIAELVYDDFTARERLLSQRLRGG